MILRFYKFRFIAIFISAIFLLSAPLSAQFSLKERLEKDKNKPQVTHVPLTDEQLCKTASALGAAVTPDKKITTTKTENLQQTKDLYRTLDLNTFNQLRSKYKNLIINYSPDLFVPSFITGFQPQSNAKGNNKLQKTDITNNYLVDNKLLFRLVNPNDELKLANSSADAEGLTHVKYEQYFDGIPIWGKELYVHLDSKDNIYLINSKTVPTFENFTTNTAILSESKIREIGSADLGKTCKIEDISAEYKALMKYTEPTLKKYIWCDNKEHKPYLVYFLNIRPNIRDNWYYFIDAVTGNVLEKYNATNFDGPTTGNGTDLNGVKRNFNVYLDKGSYYLLDQARPMYDASDPQNVKGEIYTLDNKNSDLTNTSKPTIPFSSTAAFNNPTGVSMHYSLGAVYDYYKNTHNRNSIDDKGMSIFAIIHVTDQGQTFDNAYWNGAFVVFGDGGQACKPWPGALDFIGHELTHGVVTFTVDLEYKFQSGALNEALADWGGTMVDREDWKLGEDIARSSFFPTGCVRDMQDPHNQGQKGDNVWLPAHMNEIYDLTIDQDNGGVHYNCGIINKATYLIGNQITKDKLEKIYYRVLFNKYLTKQAQFIDFRLGCVKAAGELYGNNSTEVNAVKSAFDQVGITDGTGTKPDDDLNPVNGSDFIAMVYSGDYKLYVGKGIVNDPQTEVVQVSNSVVFTGNGGVISCTDNGASILFIDENNNIRFINTQASGETLVDDSGIWNSLSISPDNRYLAVTTTLEEPKIYIFDLQNSTYKEYELYIPNTSDANTYAMPLYPSTVDWNADGSMLIYDAVNYRFDLDGNEDFYYDINLLDPASGVITRILPQMEVGIHTGSPSFSQVSPYCIAFEMYDANATQSSIFAADLFSGKMGLIITTDANSSVVSTPVYSPTDKALAFQVATSSQYAIYKIGLASDKINPSGQSSLYLTNVGIPKWFAIGQRPISVNDDIITSGLMISPNPAGDYITITTKPSEGSEINIYNMLGELVISVGTGRDLSAPINISDLPKGMYFVKVGGETAKFVKN
ncbi:MAG: M4 family metallopeptidase [bacterium]